VTGAAAGRRIKAKGKRIKATADRKTANKKCLSEEKRSLQGKDQAQTLIDGPDQARRQAAAFFREKFSIHRDELGDIDDRIFRKTGFGCRKMNIARRFCKAKIGCDNNSDDCPDATAVKRVGLDNHNGPPKTGFRRYRIRQLRPPDIPPFHYQSS
jgi:hypothetical protein